MRHNTAKVGQAIASERQATKTDRLSYGFLHFASYFAPCVLALTGAASLAKAQASPELQQILERLDRIESQNRELMSEVQALRQQLDAAKPAQPETPGAD